MLLAGDQGCRGLSWDICLYATYSTLYIGKAKGSTDEIVLELRKPVRPTVVSQEPQLDFVALARY